MELELAYTNCSPNFKSVIWLKVPVNEKALCHWLLCHVQINGVILDDRTHKDAVELFITAGDDVELRVLKKVGSTIPRNDLILVIKRLGGLLISEP